MIDKEKQEVTVDREVDDGLETLCLNLPAVITLVSCIYTISLPFIDMYRSNLII